MYRGLRRRQRDSGKHHHYPNLSEEGVPVGEYQRGRKNKETLSHGAGVSGSKWESSEPNAMETPRRVNRKYITGFAVLMEEWEQKVEKSL